MGDTESWRAQIHAIVAANPEIDLAIVHRADGGNDFFSSKPEVERCERLRVIEICWSIIRVLEDMEIRRRFGLNQGRCPGAPPVVACPATGDGEQG